MTTENGRPPGVMQQPVLLGPDIISSPVLSMVSWWIGSHGDLSAVKDLVIRNFRSDDVFSAWSKLRECHQKASGSAVPVQAPTRHRSEVKLAEEFIKELSEVEVLSR